MANQVAEYMNQLHQLRPVLGQPEPNHLEPPVRHIAMFVLFSGAAMMLSAVSDSSVNREHIFAGFLLFILGLLLGILHVSLRRGHPMAIMAARLVVVAFGWLFVARD